MGHKVALSILRIERKERDMAIGVLIKRVTKPGVDAKVLLPHIIELRALGVRQPG
jgi:hypothetical protein